MSKNSVQKGHDSFGEKLKHENAYLTKIEAHLEAKYADILAENSDGVSRLEL